MKFVSLNYTSCIIKKKSAVRIYAVELCVQCALYRKLYLVL